MLKFKLNNLKNKLLLEDKVYYINPNKIEYVSSKVFGNYKNRIIDGDWDVHNMKFEDSIDFYNSFKSRINKNTKWRETGYFKRVIKEIESGKIKWGCSNEQQFLRRCRKLDCIFNDIKENGYKPKHENDYVSVNIGRDGQILFNDGRHRLTFAKLLKLEEIPVKIVTRHKKWVEFKKKIHQYARNNEGKIYAPLNHIDLTEYNILHPNRFNILKEHVNKNSTTVLDIGAHWGYMDSEFEKLGKQCFAVENDIVNINFMKKLKKSYNQKFHIINRDIFSFISTGRKTYDTVLALNIFHHFLKEKKLYYKFIKLLNELEMEDMFFQSHNTKEPQMINAYKNFESKDFVEFIVNNSCLKQYKKIANFDGRDIYYIYK